MASQTGPDMGDLPPLPTDRAALLAFFEANAIAYDLHEHPATHTVAESGRLKAQIPGAHTKNLFMKDKSGTLVLISAEAHAELKLNRLHRLIGTQRLSFTDADLLFEALGVRPGSVTAFALVNDRAGQVRFVLDQTLFEAERVNFHPMENTATLGLSQADFRRFVALTGHEIEPVDFSALLET